MAEITILGAYGGKGIHQSTTSILISKDIVIDAGNILKALGAEAMEINNIFLTHSHLDHIADIPFLIDSCFEKRDKPLNIYGLKDTLYAIKRHIINWNIWPDFSEIQLIGKSEKSMILNEIEFNTTYSFGNIHLTPIMTNHTVPSCGYIIEKDGSKLLFASDTHICNNIWEHLNSDLSIKALIIEVSFPSKFEKLAIDSKHLTPKILQDELLKLKRSNVKIYINHLKPSYEEIIKSELRELNSELIVLEDGSRVVF